MTVSLFADAEIDSGALGYLPLVFAVPPRDVPRCEECGDVLSRDDVGLSGDQCQRCWESACARSWWALCAPFWIEEPTPCP